MSWSSYTQFMIKPFVLVVDNLLFNSIARVCDSRPEVSHRKQTNDKQRRRVGQWRLSATRSQVSHSLRFDLVLCLRC